MDSLAPEQFESAPKWFLSSGANLGISSFGLHKSGPMDISKLARIR
jgi:hypothetical protein